MDGFPILFLLATLITLVSGGRDEILRLPSDASRFFQAPAADQNQEGTRWALLIAGSNGYWNYRHQVIHAPHHIFFSHSLSLLYVFVW